MIPGAGATITWYSYSNTSTIARFSQRLNAISHRVAVLYAYHNQQMLCIRLWPRDGYRFCRLHSDGRGTDYRHSMWKYDVNNLVLVQQNINNRTIQSTLQRHQPESLYSTRTTTKKCCAYDGGYAMDTGSVVCIPAGAAPTMATTCGSTMCRELLRMLLAVYSG